MATESLYSPIDIPEVDTWDFLFEGKRAFPDDKVIYLDPKSRQYTFEDVRRTAISFGSALRRQWNWQKGDVIAWFSPNCVDTPALTYGTLFAGGVVSPANPAYSAKELAFQLKDSESKAIVTQVASLETAIEAAKIVGLPQSRILLIGDEKHGRAQHFSDFIGSAKGDSKRDRVVRAHSDLAFLVYSSGTTGLPKGVELIHRNIVSNLLMIDVGQDEIRYDGGSDGKGDIIVAVLPFFHIYGLQLLLNHPIHIGVTAIILPRFEPDAFCVAVQDYKITFCYLAPPMALFLAKSPIVEKYDLSSIKMCMSAAAPLPVDLVGAVWKRLKIPIKQGYGLSETSPGAHFQSTKDWQTKAGSVGQLLPNQSMKIVSESGELVPPGSEGEIWIKGPNIFAGYHNNPAATAHCMTEDGYFRTGDIGYQDKDGHLYITDRLKELIKYKGFQVAPAELEGLLVGHEKVADACVLGVFDASQASELPRAYLVKAAAVKDVEDSLLAREITEWVHGKVAHHKRLRGGIRFVDEIPKSATGKILRRIMRDKMKAEEDEKVKVKAKL